MGEIELNREEKYIKIISDIYLYGDLATDKLAEQFADEIQTMWNEPEGFVNIDDENYRVIFETKGYYQSNLQDEDVNYNTNPRNNYFRVEDFSPINISWVDGLGSNTGYMLIDNLYEGSTTAAHEYGHTLGLAHPANLNYIGKGQPAIMYPRGTLVDAQFQYDPTKKPGEVGGTMHPIHRRVLQSDIDDLDLPKLIRSKAKYIGQFTSIYHPKHSRPIAS